MLTAREFSLLECLARRPGQVLSREQIEARIYSERASHVSLNGSKRASRESSVSAATPRTNYAHHWPS